MTSPSRQESGPLQEWAPLTTLLQKLPAKLQVGLFAQDINFTCIDAVAEFIAIGTNHNLVYWFDRKTGKLETLVCENSGNGITCIRVVSTVEFMVAAGNDQGIITIFQIPKKISDSLPESLKPSKKPQVERFSIKGMHKVTVTAVEWSKNGMKLFSGDQDGFVVSTEINFFMRSFESTELLNEKYPVVQLSYQNGLLLISTLFRTIIVDNKQNNQVKQIGQKERKMLGKFGAVFANNKNYVDPPVIYATRPGLRIWQADKTGTVLKTLIFKGAVKTEPSRVNLLNPIPEKSKKRIKEDVKFGIIKPFSDNLLVTFNQDVIYLLNPNEITITSVVTDLRKVTDVACFEDEIFVLEGERNILRLSCYPEIDILETVPHESLEQITPIAESSKPIAWGLSDITSKLKSSSIVPAIPFHKINPTSIMQATSILPPIVIGLDTTSIINAEEAVEVCVEVPPVVSIDLDTPLVTDMEVLKKSNDSVNFKSSAIDRKDIFEKISQQDFEEVVYTPKRKEKLSSHKKEKTQSLQSAKLITNSVVPVNSKHSDEDCVSIRINELSQVSDRTESFILENGKNYENIEKAVENKEKLLYNYLDLSKYEDKIRMSNINSRASVESQRINFNPRAVIQSQTTCKSENINDEQKIGESSTDKFQNLSEYNKNENFGSDIKDSAAESHFSGNI
ncbi:WD repeat-containing protein CG11141 [Copidosoma floridanum]|uniref:WD repeat-containing protein CG11141 n=1 Tax=Copidosoma floridanum TaxID=29053 RepID=UPI0006C98DC6|nr:WD repeat-containing protein CG11141 [Copidosoma floridanum]XP_014217311.1 WD repeat-containing protein CG11141 [Copidosoma floridanum]